MSRARVPLMIVAALVLAAGCKHKAPVAKPSAPPAPQAFPTPTSNVPQPPDRPVEPPPVPVDPAMNTADVDPNVTADVKKINESGLLKPVFFAYDSDELDDAGRQALNENAQVLKKYGSWKISIEGHCDERGTAEYNMALGERRSLAAKTYLLSLGIGAERLSTVSYGKEFPFEPGHDERAYTRNRRAHLTLTAKQ